MNIIQTSDPVSIEDLRFLEGSWKEKSSGIMESWVRATDTFYGESYKIEVGEKRYWKS